MNRLPYPAGLTRKAFQTNITAACLGNRVSPVFDDPTYPNHVVLIGSDPDCVLVAMLVL